MELIFAGTYDYHRSPIVLAVVIKGAQGRARDMRAALTFAVSQQTLRYFKGRTYAKAVPHTQHCKIKGLDVEENNQICPFTI
jgi:hypothetical protein